MKKLVAVILIVIYSMACFGVGVKRFYCCGRLQSVSLTFSTQQDIGASDGYVAPGCCQTSFQSLKVRDSHIYFPSVLLVDSTQLPARLYSRFTETFLQAALPAGLKAGPSPPISQSIPLYIAYRVFRI